jgi:hypothetical protein
LSATIGNALGKSQPAVAAATAETATTSIATLEDRIGRRLVVRR